MVDGAVAEPAVKPPSVVTETLDPDTEYDEPIRVDCTAGPSTVNCTESVILDVISEDITGDAKNKVEARRKSLFILSYLISAPVFRNLSF